MSYEGVIELWVMAITLYWCSVSYSMSGPLDS